VIRFISLGYPPILFHLHTPLPALINREFEMANPSLDITTGWQVGLGNAPRDMAGFSIHGFGTSPVDAFRLAH